MSNGGWSEGEAAPVGAPLFILSLRQRDELAQQAAAAGWQVVAARRLAGVEQRFLTSGAAVAVIDARGALGEGLSGATALGGHVAAAGGAMLALVSRGDVEAIGRFFDAGATHFLASPASESEFAHALRYAARHAERMTGEWRPAVRGDPLGWRWTHEDGVRLTPALAERLSIQETAGRGTSLRLLDREDRVTAIAALRRLATSGATAFAHDLAPFGRVVEHLQRNAATGAVSALIEPLGAVPDAGALVEAAAGGALAPGEARRWIEARSGTDVGVVLVALTRFDIVNAAYGRATGDAILRGTLRRIEEVARTLFDDQAIVSRTGGSEFMLAASGSGERLALAAAQIETMLARPFAFDGAHAVLGSRIGVAMAQGGDDAFALLRRAGEALAGAKASDGATLKIADAGGVAAIDRLAVDLHRAIERGEIEVRFQPQVRIADGAITGVEALARWDHPMLGPLGADTLFAAAERADLGIALSDHVQRLALSTAAAWPASLATLRLALNLTAGDLARAGFADAFLAAVEQSGFPLARLTVEITESGLIGDLADAAVIIAGLRQAGVRVAIDDFGTGYSSLAYLRALPLDYLKLDKAMTRDISGNPRDRVVVRSVIDMARSLKLAVVAEGVETEEQRALLAREGCDLYQGFLCAGALDPTALARLVEEGR